ncbi:MAG: type II CRISPR RNA-guided endonuclease Cas9, partial [Bacteroidales bacterium]
MKKILGLDLGTNSIGWAVVNAEKENGEEQLTGIEATGSRIIPMDAAILGDFDKGNSISQTAARTDFRGTRRLRERYLLRRERLHRVLSLLKFLPEHYALQLDRYGKFAKNTEPKLAWDEKDFLFKDSFNEMIEEFKKNQPQLFESNKKVPYDWTIYFLRKKALTYKITKEELAWLLLNFNQKRGYYQLRGEEEEENPNKLVEFYALEVVAVEDSGDKKGKEPWYNVHLENGWIYHRTSNVPLDWAGKIKEFIVTTDIENDGTPKVDKDGNVKRSFRAPKEDDWTLVKKKTEADITKTAKTVGTYIYNTLLANPTQKINGKLVRTIERKFYKRELEAILSKQIEFHTELQDTAKYKACLEELYTHNDAHKSNIANNTFSYLFINDIIFYQRPLKSKKSLISNCPYESRFDKEGNTYAIKCIAKSNPLLQEFILWQFIANLKIYQREKEVDGKIKIDESVTDELLPIKKKAELFEWLNSRSSIKQDTLFNSFFKIKKPKGANNYPYRWNYVEDKEYSCNETRATILSGLQKAGTDNVLTPTQEQSLWHILYSVEDKNEIERALKSFAAKNNLNGEFATVFAKIKPFKKDYGAYSEKAIKKLLPLMRMCGYWSEEAIDAKTKERIMLIINGEYDETVRERVREKAINLTEVAHFKSLPLWLACYVVYNRHSEAKEIEKWETPTDIDTYLESFKQHSLRNPIVEQVVVETLRTVRDIWKMVGSIDEIHVELGREMKNPADKRAKMTQQIQTNENTNLRIKTLLAEFVNPEYNIENVRPYSPNQQDILRIYEEYALANLSDKDNEYEFIAKVSKLSQPSKTDVIRYKLWLEQKYRSPYTGEMIPLAKLFTPAYEIEHVIPQSRYFDDSFSNKIICEAEVNKLKDRQLGYEFIKNHAGQKVELNYGKTVEVFSVDAYEKFVKENYTRIRGKMKKLLLEDIPDGFIERQLNDSRYISKLVKGLLSNIVREKLANGEYEPDVVSKHLISCTGGVTDKLKRDWGMNDVWNRIILP